MNGAPTNRTMQLPFYLTAVLTANAEDAVDERALLAQFHNKKEITMSVELTTAKSRVGTRQYSDFGPGSSFVATYNQNNCSTRIKKQLAGAQRTDSSD